MDEKLLTAKELAVELGVKLSTVYYWTHIGYVPTVKMGRLLRFRRSSIYKWLERKESKGRVSQRIRH
ncbi:MAG: hypothetical protein DRP46_08390 [Candidatus Zixiibacteriota bacterium]|nr:MAG: hypothetical protein DRP46_08390 [candidate division Zixibacteria bacterium]